MTVSDSTETPLWVVGSGRPRPRPAPTCALCRKAPPATQFGLCLACLAAAVAEHARLTPRTGDPGDAAGNGVNRDDGRLSSVPARDLCSRCGSWKHRRTECDA